MIDVFGEVRIGIRIFEWLPEEHFLDGFGGRLDVAGTSEVLAERLTDEAPQRYPPSAGQGPGTPVELRRQQELCPVHV